MTLMLSAGDLGAIRAHAERDYPREACGLLGGAWDGDVKRVARVQAVANARDDSPRNRYLIEPEAFLRATKALEQAGLEVLGVYHSHPDHPARPSEFDREHAWPRLSYVIVRVAGGAAAEGTSWVLADDRATFHEESMVITERTVSWQSQS
jgi:proteasome lid subunit RPN8/RPN11